MKKQLGVPHVIVTLILLFWMFLSSGCMFSDLKKEVAAINLTYAIGGDVANLSPHNGPVIVVLFSEKDGTRKLFDYSLVEDLGHYSFLVPEGNYCIGAFEDRNENAQYDSGEYAAYWGAPDIIKVSDEIQVSDRSRVWGELDIDITQQNGIKESVPFRLDVDSLAKKSFTKLGAIKELDDEIFAQDKGSLGYWKPLTFLQEYGFGIYFLEPYDPQKIPILFVHGALGTPSGWATIVENLDRKRFQPWFYYYPSGLRLNMSSSGLNALVTKLNKTYQFKNLYVFAHSMGGLVSRSFIMKNMYEDGNEYIKLFVSVSTPWNGHKATAKGVENAPESIPSWHDMVPDSEFIQAIFSKDLPADVSSYLFFSFRGNFSFFIDNNDGTVEISSQLDPRAQKDADRLFGYDEDHGSILESQLFIDQFNRILEIGGRQGVLKDEYYIGSKK